MSLDLTAMNAVHDAIRRDLVRFVQVFAGTDPVSPRRSVALGRHWEFVARVLGHYTATQDQLLWPAARTAVPASEQAPLDFIDEKQPVLVDRIAVVAAAFAGGAAAGGPAERHVLAESVERLAMLADQRFGYEESTVGPVLIKYLSDAEWEPFEAALVSVTDPEQLLPWVLDAAPADVIATLLGGLSVDDQEGYAAVWKPTYRDEINELW